MGTVQATPKPNSYVTEWEAIHVENAGDYATIKRLMRNSPWSVQIVLEKDDEAHFVFTAQHGNGLEQWNMSAGDWVVRSPHGKFWFMGNEEFLGAFTWWAES